jgi:hypothetical protein
MTPMTPLAPLLALASCTGGQPLGGKDSADTAAPTSSSALLSCPEPPEICVVGATVSPSNGQAVDAGPVEVEVTLGTYDPYDAQVELEVVLLDGDDVVASGAGVGSVTLSEDLPIGTWQVEARWACEPGGDIGCGERATWFRTRTLATETFEVLYRERIDLLFVLSSASGIDDAREAIAAQDVYIFDTFFGSPVDVHIGVTSMDTATDGVLLTPSGPGFFTRDAPDLYALGGAIRATATGGTDLGTQAVSRALRDHAVPGGANEGFLRSDSALQVVVVDDAEDASDAAIAADLLAWISAEAAIRPVEVHGMLPAGVGAAYRDLVAATDGLVLPLPTTGWSLRASLSAAWISTEETYCIDHVPLVAPWVALDDDELEIDVDYVWDGGSCITFTGRSVWPDQTIVVTYEL